MTVTVGCNGESHRDKSVTLKPRLRNNDSEYSCTYAWINVEMSNGSTLSQRCFAGRPQVGLGISVEMVDSALRLSCFQKSLTHVSCIF